MMADDTAVSMHKKFTVQGYLIPVSMPVRQKITSLEALDCSSNYGTKIQNGSSFTEELIEARKTS
jgi:hypothetical protein